MESLSCTDVPMNERYSFYEHIDVYLKYKNVCCSNNQCEQYNNICIFNDLEFDDDENDDLALICKRFNCIFDKLFTSSNIKTNKNENYHLAYLNYWLNYELHNITAGIPDPNDFFRRMRSQGNKKDSLRKLYGKLYLIEEDELKNMHWLFNLYEDYIENNITNDNTNEENFEQYTNQCVRKYQEHGVKYPKNMTPFCEALCAFKKKYKNIDLKISDVEVFENNEQIEIKGEDNFDIPTNIIIGTSVATVGVSSLFFLFYKVKNK
ncbi:hypothetical protein PCYB_003750 [Plasmodium cynomolgi strain B]|uniref:CYIR protein n=1 Tax=Plasmodium cynomolgi (strain B) TaxID=1120755 RepID=K6UF78_PLACD|nr:hypothetical protein PCYB_003750 [Plasmodium cynomolgi strain B]GAB69626.1 hypothetical protein PCYB_003750 [Plasmodium cynomolgi strain B]